MKKAMATRKYVSYWDRDSTMGWVELRGGYGQPLRTPGGIEVDVKLTLEACGDVDPCGSPVVLYILSYQVHPRCLAACLVEVDECVEFPTDWTDGALTDDPDDHLHVQLDAMLPPLLAYADKAATGLVAAPQPSKPEKYKLAWARFAEPLRAQVAVLDETDLREIVVTTLAHLIRCGSGGPRIADVGELGGADLIEELSYMFHAAGIDVGQER